MLQYVLDLKKAGRIRHIGLSSHNPQVALKAVQSGHIEVLMFSVNPGYDLQPASEDVEDLWREKNYAAPLVNMDSERQELYEAVSYTHLNILEPTLIYNIEEAFPVVWRIKFGRQGIFLIQKPGGNTDYEGNP